MRSQSIEASQSMIHSQKENDQNKSKKGKQLTIFNQEDDNLGPSTPNRSYRDLLKHDDPDLKSIGLGGTALRK